MLAAIPAEKCTAIYGSPSMLIALIDHPEFAEDEDIRDLENVKEISLLELLIDELAEICPMEPKQKE